jgi:glycosyltransferase involved in cell wall biosynthesis
LEAIKLKKILLISGDPFSDIYGGVEEHTNNLVSNLIKKNDLEIYWINYCTKEIEFHANNLHIIKPLKIKNNNPILNILMILINIIYILNYIKIFKPHVIHFQGTHPIFCLASIICQQKIVTIVTIHGYLRKESEILPRGFFHDKVSVLFEKKVIENNNFVIVVSPFIKQIIDEENIRKNKIELQYIPNGIDPTISDLVLESVALSKYVIFLGNLNQIKGVEYLIKAMELINLNKIDIILNIVGTGPDEQRLKKMVNDLGLDERVKFLGPKYGVQKYQLLLMSQIVVIPSIWESFPIVMLEALALGKPIIASNVGGIPYIIEDGKNGYLVDVGDFEGIANRIVLLMNDEQSRMDISENNLELAKKYSWEIIVLKTYDFYINALKIMISPR